MVVGKGHPLALKGVASYEDLADHPVVTTSAKDDFVDHYMPRRTPSGRSIERRHRVDTIDAGFALVASGNLVDDRLRRGRGAPVPAGEPFNLLGERDPLTGGVAAPEPFDSQGDSHCRSGRLQVGQGPPVAAVRMFEVEPATWTRSDGGPGRGGDGHQVIGACDIGDIEIAKMREQQYQQG
jgi:hypothetical protein